MGSMGAQVLWSTTLVVECHAAAAMEVARLIRSVMGVDRQLLVIRTDAMAVSICLRKDAELACEMD